jgi:hypothetical protein
MPCLMDKRWMAQRRCDGKTSEGSMLEWACSPWR